MIPKFIDTSRLPHKSGIYIYKDSLDQVLYVGKAIDLYHRVASYFSGPSDSAKTAALVSQIKKVETIIVESELEALILEANLIKKYLPPFNIRLTDDKDYLYIAITKEDFPKVITARKKDLKFVKRYFGPFPSSRTVKTTLKKLRKIFPWCSNPPRSDVRFRPCFYYHLNLCPGACVGKISKQDYHKIINRFIKFLEGKKQELVNELSIEMADDAKNLEFEKADGLKKVILGIEYLTQPNRVEHYLENPNFLEDQTRLGLAELQKVLKLPEYPDRIEGYDISNISGKEATGAMVVLTQGEIDKSQYRKFKIKISGKPNDYAMHQEIMRRRLRHPDWGIPQLILIDGGRGQARAVRDVILGRSEATTPESIKDSGHASFARMINIPLFGLAKRMEWLYPPDGEVIKLPKKSLALRLLQNLRDESHRFAITYHRKLRVKKFLS